MTWGHTSFSEKFMSSLYNVDIPEKLNKKYIAEKYEFEILRWPYVTFNVTWGHTLFNKKFKSLWC